MSDRAFAEGEIVGVLTTEPLGDRAFAEGEIVGVLTTEPLGRVLDYKAPEGGCGTGDFVEVPLGPRRVLGVVWCKGEGRWDPAKVRPVVRVLDVAPMREELRLFLSRAADYTLTPLPAMLRLATRAPGLAEPPGTRRVYRLAGPVPNTLTEARHRVVARRGGLARFRRRGGDAGRVDRGRGLRRGRGERVGEAGRAGRG